MVSRWFTLCNTVLHLAYQPSNPSPSHHITLRCGGTPYLHVEYRQPYGFQFFQNSSVPSSFSSCKFSEWLSPFLKWHTIKVSSSHSSFFPSFTFLLAITLPLPLLASRNSCAAHNSWIMQLLFQHRPPSSPIGITALMCGVAHPSQHSWTGWDSKKFVPSIDSLSLILYSLCFCLHHNVASLM